MIEEADGEPTAYENVATRLPLPEVTSQAILSGIFGRCANGCYRPSPRELKEFVDAQVDGLVNLRRQIDGYQRAEQLGCHPLSGQPAKSPVRQAANRRRASQLVKEFGLRYLGHLGAYEQAFGVAARVELDEFVRAVTGSLRKSNEPMMQQRELF